MNWCKVCGTETYNYIVSLCDDHYCQYYQYYKEHEKQEEQ